MLTDVDSDIVLRDVPCINDDIVVSGRSYGLRFTSALESLTFSVCVTHSLRSKKEMWHFICLVAVHGAVRGEQYVSEYGHVNASIDDASEWIPAELNGVQVTDEHLQRRTYKSDTSWKTPFICGRRKNYVDTIFPVGLDIRHRFCQGTLSDKEWQRFESNPRVHRKPDCNWYEMEICFEVGTVKEKSKWESRDVTVTVNGSVVTCSVNVNMRPSRIVLMQATGNTYRRVFSVPLSNAPLQTTHIDQTKCSGNELRGRGTVVMIGSSGLYCTSSDDHDYAVRARWISSSIAHGDWQCDVWLRRSPDNILRGRGRGPVTIVSRHDAPLSLHPLNREASRSGYLDSPLLTIVTVFICMNYT
ncbi:t18 [Tupaiid betaherpesvirus 1]|uniref:T18 n=1 Tax=Tupaiid herpesvirus 1 (strain 1) TaxID=10397 RepID=Q91TU3_TUHV1|nr:t18 [Tupaiid betaherpesvirus 1]AAK57044.1 t18 [Tupaiid betaherpesvirus 1]